MAALDAWTVLPLCAALAAGLLIGARVRALAFRAALDGPKFGRELTRRLAAGRIDAARALAEQLRPAWAAELTLRVLLAREQRDDPAFALEEVRSDFELAAQRGLLAIRSLGRIALPLSLAIAIAELGQGFAPALDRAEAGGLALTRGFFAVSVGIAVSLVCQIAYGLLTREAKRRLDEVRIASEVLRAKN